ncbi:hypothetical protein Tco_0303253 [Tanacetum coccineum]
MNKTVLTQADFKGQAYEVVKAFYPDVIHLQFQMEECHKMLTDRVDWANPEGDQVRINVNRPLPLGGPPGHVTIQTEFFFNKDLEYLRYGSKGSCPALSISKMKAASYPDFGLELLVPEQMWIDDVCTYDVSAKYGISHWWFTRQKFYIDRHDSPSRRKEVRTHMRILSVVRIKAYSRYRYDYLSEIVLRIADHQEHKIAEKYPSDFKDLNLLLLQVIRQRVEDFQLGIESYQTQLNLTKPGWDATGYEFKHDYTIIESPRAVIFPVNNNERKIMRFNEIYKFSGGTLTRILETLDYRVKEFKIKRLNPSDQRQEGSTGTWNALLVDVFVILTTGFFRELNDIVILSKRSISCVESRRLQMLAKDMSIHYPMLTLHIPNQRQHDSQRLHTSATPDLAIMIKKRLSHAVPKVTTLHGSNTLQQRMLKRFTEADDLEECSKITQVKGTKPKSTTLCTKLSMNEESKTTSLKLNVQDLGC